MNGHTPGPWTLETVPTAVGHCHKIGPFPSKGLRQQTYACVYADGIPMGGPAHDVLQANARLIAAAPDLLAACRMVAEMAVGWQPLTPGDIAEVRAAIAKAEGQ